MSSNVTSEILTVPGPTVPSLGDEANHLSRHAPMSEKKMDLGFTIAQHQSETCPTIKDAHQSVGLSVIEQSTTIPQTGERLITSRREYWLYIFYCMSHRPPHHADRVSLVIGGQGAGESGGV